MMHYWNLLSDWNTLDSVRAVHSFLEAGALLCFGMLVLFDVLSHMSDEHPVRAKRFEKVGLWFFGIAVLAEILAYPYGQRNDTLSNQLLVGQRAKIASLDNSTQQLKTDADQAKVQAGAFKARVADSNSRAKAAEAQVALAKAASDAASAKAEGFRLEIAQANETAKQAEARAAEANLGLARYKAPRSISSAQEEQIVALLRSFSGQEVQVVLCAQEQEAGMFAQRVANVLGKAGLKPAIDELMGMGPPCMGFGVAVHDEKSAPALARIIVSSFRSAGVSIGGIPEPTMVEEGKFLVFIGAKPSLQ